MQQIVIFLIITFSLNHVCFGKDQLELKDLGIKAEELHKDEGMQEKLDTRSLKLQRHQYWGVATLGLMAATFLTAEEAHEAGEEAGTGGSELHQYLGIATAAAYWTTFYYQYTAPQIATTGTEEGWNTKLHKNLAWVHAPLMALTTIAGLMAWQAHKDGKKPKGLAANKEGLGQATMATFGMAGVLMVFEF